MEIDEGKLIVVEESRKRKSGNDPDELDIVSVTEIDDEESSSSRPVLPVRGRDMFTNQVVQLSETGEKPVGQANYGPYEGLKYGYCWTKY